MQQQGKNPNEVMCLVCKHCLISQLQAGHITGLVDKVKIEGYLGHWGETDTVDQNTHLMFCFIIAFYTYTEYKNLLYVHI